MAEMENREDEGTVSTNERKGIPIWGMVRSSLYITFLLIAAGVILNRTGVIGPGMSAGDIIENLADLTTAFGVLVVAVAGGFLGHAWLHRKEEDRPHWERHMLENAPWMFLAAGLVAVSTALAIIF